MKILLAVHHTLSPHGGAEGVTLALGSQLRAFGHDVEYFGFREAFGDAVVGHETSWHPLRFPWRLAAFLKRKAREFDVMDVTSGDNWVWDRRGRPGAKAKHALITRSHGLEHVSAKLYRDWLSERGEKPRVKTRLYHLGYRLWEVRQSLLRSDLNILLNDPDRELAIRELHVPAEKLVVLPNGIDAIFLDTPKPQYSDVGPLKLAFIGTWIQRKGNDIAVAAMRELAAAGVDFQLTVFGARTPAESVLADFDPTARSRVAVVPQFAHDQLPKLLEGHEVLIFPSRSEGFSMALTEAMACGLTPIATPVGGAPKLISDGKNGFLVPVNQWQEMVRHITSLAGNRTALLEMRKAAQETAHQFGWEIIAKQTLDLYEATINRAI